MNTAAEVSSDICTGCGTCAGICPNKAVTMRVSKGVYLPKAEEEKCTRCGLCTRSFDSEKNIGKTMKFALSQYINADVVANLPKTHRGC